MKATLFSFVLGLAVIAIFLAIGFSQARSGEETGPGNPNPPVAVTQKVKEDLGAMTNQEIKTTQFSIKNTGSTPLELTKVSTSCDCTYAYLIIGGQKSPKFTMHGTTIWKGEVAPGTEATLEVVYEPAIMPVKGAVSRMVSVSTNDPQRPTLMFELTATVTQ